MELPDLYVDQGHGQLKLLIGHLKLRDEVGQQIMCFLSELQLFIGSGSPVLTIPFQTYGCLVDNYWLVSAWKHMSQIGITIDVEDVWTPTIPRQSDAALMDVALQYNFSSQELREIT